jgi:plastocyanin
MKGVPMRIVVLLAAAIGALTLTAAAPATTTVGKLTATVGPGFTITMSAKKVKHGTYKITVRDRSSIHNFHLIGPGVNKKTSVAGVKTVTWTLALKLGTYRFKCDPHATVMKGSVRVT